MFRKNQVFFFGLFFLLNFSTVVFAQTSVDSAVFARISSEALVHGEAYKNLEYLCKKIGGRLSCSPQAAKAVEWGSRLMKSYGFDSVWLQEVQVPCWKRGQKEEVLLQNSQGKRTKLSACALGGSVPTPANGLKARVVEVESFDELKRLGRKNVEGAIVFYNRKFDETEINTFRAYSRCSPLRLDGADSAAALGAAAVVVRSLTGSSDEHPHTGAVRYGNNEKIPAFALSTQSADLLSQTLKKNANLQLSLKSDCELLPDEISYNVIGELKGSEHPEEILIVGGHLDSWDFGEGAHDDGAGCVQSIEVLRIFKALNIKPKRTVRAVLFMNEENGNRGGITYAEQAVVRKEKHIFALESDRGGFSPKGFSFKAKKEQLARLFLAKELFVPYEAADLQPGYGGVDIDPLSKTGTVCAGIVPDSQRYFDYHHSAMDTFDKVHRRELHLSSAVMAMLMYWVSEYGL